jgi:hypothetical protein
MARRRRGLKAGDVANWEDGEGARVELDVEMATRKIWTIRRSWKPNRWELVDSIFNHVEQDLTKDESNPVMDAIRLEFAPFLSSVLMAQGLPMFLDQEATKKAELFSDVMGLDKWLGYSDRASTKAREQDSISRQLERRCSELSGKLDALVQQDFSDSVDAWEAERAKRLDELEGRHASMCSRLENEKDQFPVMQRLEDGAREQYAIQLRCSEEWLANVEVQREKYHEAQTDLALAQERRDAASGSRSVDGTCPTCGHKLDRFHAGNHRDQVRKLEEEVLQRQQEAEHAGRGLAKVKERARKEAEILKKTLQALDLCVAQTKDIRRAIELCERDLDRIEAEADQIYKEENPHAKRAEEAQRNVDEIRQEMKSTQRKLDASNERYSMLSYWVRGFKEVRLQEIGEALGELEIEVNSELTALGLVDWSLLFDLDRETKGGKIQRGFSVYVQSPHNDRLVPWEAWSGGEGQRLRLAGNMGLANLIRARSGTKLDLEVWDEPTQWMSAGGVLDLLNVLKQRAIREGRQIWLVDHRSLGYGGFDGTCTVVKTSKGSRFQQKVV